MRKKSSRSPVRNRNKLLMTNSLFSTTMAVKESVLSSVAAPASLLVNTRKYKAKQACTNLTMSQVATPVGPLSLGTSDDGLRVAYFDTWWEDDRTEAVRGHEAADVLMREAKVQVQEYFAGQRTEFTIPLAPDGTSFQKKAWAALAKIKYGETVSYEDQAKSMGEPGKARAVGAANGKNPVCLFLPCHRVIAKDGGLCGYAFGLDVKEYLLNHESRIKLTA